MSPMMIDEERHQARSAVLRRIGHEREPADHVAAHQVVDFAARGIWPLPGENPKIVTMIRSALTVDGISLRRRSGCELTERALVLAG
jgi:hypothetical protein